MDNGGWDGSCDTWKNFYAPVSAENTFTPIANGTGPYFLENWAVGTEVVLAKNESYWGDPAKLDRVLIKEIAEFGTRFSMLQAGDADIIVVPAEFRSQVDPMVAQMRVYDADTNAYGDVQNVCGVDTALLGLARFTTCDTASTQPLRLYIGRPGLAQDVVLFNFLIE